MISKEEIIKEEIMNRATAERVMESWIEETLKKERERLLERIKISLHQSDDDENRFHITPELYDDAIREIIETLELYMEDHPEP